MTIIRKKKVSKLEIELDCLNLDETKTGMYCKYRQGRLKELGCNGCEYYDNGSGVYENRECYEGRE